MVRLTATLCKTRFAFQKKQIFKRKGIYKVHYQTRIVPDMLKAKGIQCVDAMEYVKPPPEPWQPPAEMLEDFRLQTPPRQPEDREDYHKKPIYHLSNGNIFTEDIDQACILTKTQRFEGLPPQIQDNLNKYSIPKQDEMVQQAIMRSQVWNPTKERLPKRIDPENRKWVFRREIGIPDQKAAMLLMNNFITLGQTMSGKFPALSTERRNIFKPSVETSYDFKGETIQVNAVNGCLSLGHLPLPAFGDENAVSASASHDLLDMYPVSPTIDLSQTHNYTLKNRGALQEVLEVQCSHPQTVFRSNGLPWQPAVHQAYNLMVTFAIAVTEARSRYGITSGPLPSPITVQNVNCSYNTFNFLCFQLNTMDLTSDSGIKNLAWFDTDNKLFKRIKTQPWKEENKRYQKTKYEDFDASVFQKFLAVYLHGCC